MLASGPTSRALRKGDRQRMCKMYFLKTLISFCPSEEFCRTPASSHSKAGREALLFLFNLLMGIFCITQLLNTDSNGLSQTKAICKNSLLFPPNLIFPFSTGLKPCSKGNREASKNAQMDACIQMNMILLEFHRKGKGSGASKPGLATDLPLAPTPATRWASEFSAKLNVFIMLAGRRFNCPWLLLRGIVEQLLPQSQGRAVKWSW